jgi:hypothetical protein
MTKEWISLAVPWLFVTNTLVFLALSAIWFLRARRTEAVLFLWAAIGFALGAVLLLDWKRQAPNDNTPLPTCAGREMMTLTVSIEDIIIEIEEQTDRGAASIAAAVIEEVLEAAITYYDIQSTA